MLRPEILAFLSVIAIERISINSDDNERVLLEVIKAISYSMLTVVTGLCACGLHILFNQHNSMRKE